MKAVRYDGYGDTDVLEVREVDRPSAGPDEVLVQVRAAGINPGEAKIRAGALAELFPSTFPSGQGSDLAGVVAEAAAGWSVGDEVLGWVDTRSSHAEYAAVPADQLIAKPAALDWRVAGGLFVAGATAWAMVEAVDPQPGETVLLSGAAGGVGGLVGQLVRERGATVIGVAGPSNEGWLADHGITRVGYDGGAEAITRRIGAAAPDGVDVLLDTVGGGYVEIALALGVEPKRIDTIADFDAGPKHGVLLAGNAEGASAGTLTELASRLADGRLELPIAAAYPLAEVRAAFAELERGHARGKIVLEP